MFLPTSGHSSFRLESTNVMRICAGMYADFGLCPLSVGVNSLTERVCNVAMREGPDIMIFERNGTGKASGSDDFGGET